MLSIRTNLSSLIAQNNLLANSTKLDQAIERMTTGSKINHAKDNAANYSISTNMQTRMGALRVAEDNTLQAMEMMSTTTESLNQISDKLTRMRALAVQSMNGTFEGRSLDAINAEANSILKEINRINECAEYDGVKLFNTGKAEVTNAGKELKLNEQGFLQDVVKVDTTGMTPLSSMADDATLAVGEYTIGSKEELVQLQSMAAAGLVEAGSTFVLVDNIDLSSYLNWTPINLNNITFNGNGHTISNLNITGGSTTGLFGTSHYSTFMNLKIKNASITNVGAHTGVLCGDGQGSTITNCSVFRSKVNAKAHNIGGFVGSAYVVNFKYCYFEGDVSGTNAVGGIAGRGKASYCYVKGNVSASLTWGSAGGILADADSVSKCRSEANVRAYTAAGISNSYAGSDCYANGTIYGKNKAGGIFGNVYNTAKINNSIFEGEVSGDNLVGVFCASSSHKLSLENNYYYSKNSSIDLVGDETNITILNAIDIKIPCDYTFQIGTTGDKATSSVAYTTYIDFTPLKELLTNGVDSTQCLAKIDELVEIVSLKQTELGTMENRLMSVLDEISTQYENLASSYSTIHDADIADVSSSYIKQQIIQQAGASLLASTQNIQYQNVMGLLQSLR